MPTTSSLALTTILYYSLLSALHYVTALSGFPLFTALCVGAPASCPAMSPGSELSLVLEIGHNEYLYFLFYCFIRILLLEQK